MAEIMAAAVVLHLVRGLSLLEPHTFIKWYDVSAVVCRSVRLLSGAFIQQSSCMLCTLAETAVISVSQGVERVPLDERCPQLCVQSVKTG